MKNNPILRVEFKCIDGTVIERDWYFNYDPKKVPNMPNFLDDVEPLISDRSKVWDNPQDPVTFRGTVIPGSEEQVRKLVEGYNP